MKTKLNTEMNFNTITLVVLLYLMLPNSFVFSQTKTLEAKKSYGFIENKGQLAYEGGQLANDVFFQLKSREVEMFIGTKGLTYFFSKVEKNKRNPKEENRFALESKVSWEKMEVELVNGQIKKDNIITEEPNTDYLNYYYPHCPNGVLQVKSYKKIILKEVYPNIDWVFYLDNEQFVKYDFIVHPKGDVNQIKFKYKGSKNMVLEAEERKIKIKNKIGTLADEGLISFNNGKKIKTSFTVFENNVFGFSVKEKYDKSTDLVIDPALIWSTYYGASDEDEMYGIYSDGDSVYLTGVVNANTFAMRLNPGGGAYVGGYSAATDGHISRFDTAGVRQWATYYGGSAIDVFWDIESNGASVWAVGYSGSTDMPTQNPGGGAFFSGVKSGGNDAFIAKFNSLGVREWATYYGGASSDGFSDLEFDGTNLWVVGHSGSNAQLHQINSSNAITTVSMGGTGTNVFEDISYDGTYLWVAGRSNSATFPMINPGGGAYFDNTINGIIDVIMLRFNTSGVCSWSTFIGGSLEDYPSGVFSNGTNVWMLSTTKSSDFPTLNPGGTAYYDGVKSNSSPSQSKVITRFNTSCVRQWGSYFDGSGGCDFEGDVTGDNNNVVFVSASSSSDFPTQAKAGAYNDNTLGTAFITNAVVVQFNSSDELEWSTFIGGADVAELNSAHYDGTNLWACGWSWSSFPTINPGGGAYFKSTVGGPSDAIILKFASLGGPCGACALSGSGSTWTWTGCLSTDWFNPCNWDRQSVPNASSNVIVPNTANKPLITAGTANCFDINVQSSLGAEVNLNTTGGGILNITKP